MGGPATSTRPRSAAETLLGSRLHSSERGLKWTSFGIAVVIHALILMINFPEFRQAIVPHEQKNYIVVRKYVPPPPKVERPRRVVEQRTRRIPIPDPTPDAPEPIREPLPEIQPEPLPPDAEFLIGVPDPSPPARGSGPLIAGVGGVTQPLRIAESYVRPQYPEMARVARIEGRVVLQAVILSDGSVGDVDVLSCNRPSLGFEGAATAAVKSWYYKPAMQDGRAVDVYFTVLVDFELL